MPSFEEIKQKWSESAEVLKDEQGLSPTARDPYLQEAVEQAITKRLFSEATLLDIGCGNGASTLKFSKDVSKAVGVDYIPQYVEQAQSLKREYQVNNVEFAVGDVMDLKPVYEQYGAFDIVTSIRCLINLPDWASQQAALEEIAGMIKPGGLFLTSEGWDEGMIGLNLRRTAAGLTPINVVEYNLMMTRNNFEQEVLKHFDIIDYSNLGLYLYVSRVLQPAYRAPEAPQHDHPLNQLAVKLQNSHVSQRDFYDCDYAGVYVLRRKTT